MRAIFEKGKAIGTVIAPTSKSIAHRMLICAAFCQNGVSHLKGQFDCEDLQATMACLRKMGVQILQTEEGVSVRGIHPSEAVIGGALPCGESGSTLRFLVPFALLTEQETIFETEGRLSERPMNFYRDLLIGQQETFDIRSNQIRIKGHLKAGKYRVIDQSSSQFVTGLLLALPLLPQDSRIELSEPVQSRSYMDLTVDVMKRFGVTVRCPSNTVFEIPGNQQFHPLDTEVEGDASGAAYIDAYSFVGGKVAVKGLNEHSAQGDICYRELMEQLNSRTAEISLRNCPDLGPVLFALAAVGQGGYFTEIERLRTKESDRIEAMQKGLSAFGIRSETDGNGIRIYPSQPIPPSGVLNGCSDHRIVMALSLLLSLTGGSIDSTEAVKKSYPSYFQDLRRLGIPVRLEPEQKRTDSKKGTEKL